MKKSAYAVRENIRNVKKEAITAYGDDIKKIQNTYLKLGYSNKNSAIFTKGDEIIKLTKQGIKSKLTSELKKFGVNVDSSKKTFDFFESPFTGNEEAILKKAFDYTQKWSDITPTGLNKLATKISGLRKAGAQSKELNSIIDSISGSLRKYIGNKITEISTMNNNYANSMKFIEAISDELSAKGAIESTKGIIKTSRKLATIFGSNKELARSLVEELDSGSKVLNVEAARQLSQKPPKGSLSLDRILQTAVQTVIPPKSIGYLAAGSGLAEQKIKPIIDVLQKLEPVDRQALMNALKSGGFFE